MGVVCCYAILVIGDWWELKIEIISRHSLDFQNHPQKNPGCERNPCSKGAWESRDSMSVRVLKFPSSRKCSGIPPQDRHNKQLQVRAHNSTRRVCFTPVTPLEGHVFWFSSRIWIVLNFGWLKFLFYPFFHGLWTSREKENLNFGNITSFRKCSWWVQHKTWISEKKSGHIIHFPCLFRTVYIMISASLTPPKLNITQGLCWFRGSIVFLQLISTGSHCIITIW